jgi:hypothetical protein
MEHPDESVRIQAYKVARAFSMLKKIQFYYTKRIVSAQLREDMQNNRLQLSEEFLVTQMQYDDWFREAIEDVQINVVAGLGEPDEQTVLSVSGHQHHTHTDPNDLVEFYDSCQLNNAGITKKRGRRFQSDHVDWWRVGTTGYNICVELAPFKDGSRQYGKTAVINAIFADELST